MVKHHFEKKVLCLQFIYGVSPETGALVTGKGFADLKWHGGEEKRIVCHKEAHDDILRMDQTGG